MSARLVAQNVVSVNPDAAAVTLRPVTGDPDVAATVVNVIWPTSVIRAVAHRDRIPDTRRGGDGRPINGGARSGRKAESQEKYGRFFHLRFLCFVRGNYFPFENGFVDAAPQGWVIYGGRAPGGAAK